MSKSTLLRSQREPTKLRSLPPWRKLSRRLLRKPTDKDSP